MPRRRAQSAAVRPSLFFADGSAPAASSSSTICIAFASSSGSHQSGVMPSLLDARGAARILCQNVAHAIDVAVETQRPDIAAVPAEKLGPSRSCRRARPSQSASRCSSTRVDRSPLRARRGTPPHGARCWPRPRAARACRFGPGSREKSRGPEAARARRADRVSRPRTSPPATPGIRDARASNARAPSRSSRKHASMNRSVSSRAGVERNAP